MAEHRPPWEFTDAQFVQSLHARWNEAREKAAGRIPNDNNAYINQKQVCVRL